MADRAFPEGSTGPLTVEGGAASAFIAFAELAGGGADDLTMFIAVAKLGPGCEPAGGGEPRFRLRASGGAVAQVARFPNAVTIKDDAGSAVADATYEARDDGVYLVRVFVIRPGSAWELQIANDDAEARAFTWVVADSAAGARRPWIDVTPAALAFDVMAGDEQTLPARVANRGTGPLRIADAVGFSPGAGFALAAVPGPLDPNACGELQIRFTGAQAGTTSADYSASSNDAGASDAAGHNRRIALSAVTRKLVPGTIIALLPNASGVVEVVRIDPAFGAIKRIASGPPFVSPAAVALDPELNVLVVDRDTFGGTGGVMRVDPASGQVTTLSQGQRFVSPTAIAFEGDGTILIADELAEDETGAIIRVHPATGEQRLVCSGALRFRRPNAVAFGADQRILFLATGLTGSGAHVYRVDPAGPQHRVCELSNSAGGLSLCVEPGGAILAADSFPVAGGGFTGTVGRISRIAPGDGSQVSLSSGNSLRARGMAVEANGQIVVAGHDLVPGLVRVDRTSGLRARLPGAAGHTPAMPVAVAVVGG
jgi:hypothetical protein